jgi:GT2 family glycosyltransferase
MNWRLKLDSYRGSLKHKTLAAARQMLDLAAPVLGPGGARLQSLARAGKQVVLQSQLGDLAAGPLTELEGLWNRGRKALWPEQTPYEPPTAAEVPEPVWRERVHALCHKPLISIITPVYRTPERWLRRAVESIRGQFYPYWELCLIDDGSGDASLSALLAELTASDSRIRVLVQPRNGGIAAASNAGIASCSGEFIALCDHDDELTPDALYWVAVTLATAPHTDIIYSDEDKIDTRGVCSEPFLKPDFSPELLLNYMYTGHLTVYRKSLVQQLGGFRSEFDFSQDYDLMLRAVEATEAIVHIPRILYHWRKLPESAAGGGKSFARTTNLAALQSALDRRGIAATTAALPTANRVIFTQPPTPRVSLIIPSDSEANIGQSLASIAENTAYPDLEIVIVTNSGLADKLAGRAQSDPRVRFHRFDKPFNFSLKCNEGVAVATGEIVVFFNDDVRPLEPSWVQNLIELLALPAVGAVAPKLLYENEKVQHAGLVTGVRGLVGTAFHCQPADSLIHFNFVQAVRDVSALSGACLAMRRSVFLELGGYDAVNTPINHSDVDLCFRIRERGLRCVYTPYTTLLHIGHLSLREFDKEKEKEKEREKEKPKRHKDKSDLYLLKRWAGYTGHDPYYTEPMRNLLYMDSAGPINMCGSNDSRPYPLGVDALFVTHELSDSGAPLVLFYAVQAFVARGGFATVLSPVDGPFRERFTALGVPVICDSLALSSPESSRKLLAGFDVVVANTIECWPLVALAEKEFVPTIWYVHESAYLEHKAKVVPGFRAALKRAPNLIVGSYRSLKYCQALNPRTRVFSYGVEEFSQPVAAQDKIIFSVLGAIEPRKGQDVFARAVQALPESCRAQAEFWIVGRTIIPEQLELLQRLSEKLPCLRLLGPVSLERYREIMLSSDVVVCPSRDDTLPLVTLDALGCGKALILSNTTGTVDFLTPGVQGVVFKSEDHRQLAACMQQLIEDPARRQRLGQAGRELFLKNFSLAGFRDRFVELMLSVARSRTGVPLDSVAEGLAS